MRWAVVFESKKARFRAAHELRRLGVPFELCLAGELKHEVF